MNDIRYDSVNSYTATIYVGLKDTMNHEVKDFDEVERICQEYTDKYSKCVSVTPTFFKYKRGDEPGAIIGFINYPRFPASNSSIKSDALILARKLLIGLNQMRVSVVFPDETIMLSNYELIEQYKKIKNEH